MTKWRYLLSACAALAISSPALAQPTVFLPRHSPSQHPPVPERQHSDTHPGDPEPDAQVTGRIADVDAGARSITLSTGYSFTIPAWINFDQLRDGTMVSVVYTPNPHRGTAVVKTISII